jgi:hypothetical protein
LGSRRPHAVLEGVRQHFAGALVAETLYDMGNSLWVHVENLEYRHRRKSGHSQQPIEFLLGNAAARAASTALSDEMFESGHIDPS